MRVVRRGNAIDHDQSWFASDRRLYSEQLTELFLLSYHPSLMKSAILLRSLYEGHHVVMELVLVVGNNPALQDQDKQGLDSLALRPAVHAASNHTTKSSLCPLPHLACIALGDSHKGLGAWWGQERTLWSWAYVFNEVSTLSRLQPASFLPKKQLQRAAQIAGATTLCGAELAMCSSCRGPSCRPWMPALAW